MMRRRNTLMADEAPIDPAVAAELAALEAALRGEPVDDDALASLVRDVQAQAPVLSQEARGALNDEVAQGFPRRGGGRVVGKTAQGTKQPGRLLFGGGLAAAATSLVLVVGIVGFAGRGDDSGGGLSDSGVTRTESVPQVDAASAPSSESSAAGAYATATESDVAREVDLASSTALSATSRSADRAAASSPSTKFQAKTSTPASGKRRVERAVDLTVRVKSGELSDAAGKVGDITRQAGGYVADSQVSIRRRGAGTATFTLQVATSKLDGAIGKLSDLGTVTSQDQRSTDITSSFDSAQQRLNDANAVRRALLRALAKADTAGEIASLRSRIADNRKTRAALDAQLSGLQRRTNLTTVALTLRAPSGDAPRTDDDGQWSVGDAAGDALGILGTVTGVLLVGVAALLPFAILVAIGWGLYVARRRRVRDGALDQ